MKELTIKTLITAGAIGVLVLHAIRPDLRIDLVSLGLLIAAILPWLSSVIKSAEFPGGWKVEFQEVKQAGDKVTRGTAQAILVAQSDYNVIAERDPNLALVSLE